MPIRVLTRLSRNRPSRRPCDHLHLLGEPVSANTLVAFCVACLFLLSCLVVLLSFAERKRKYRRPRSEQQTETQVWPEKKEENF